MDKLDLKPCPWCGAIPVHVADEGEIVKHPVGQCPISEHSMFSGDWNRRAALPVEEQGPRPVDLLQEAVEIMDSWPIPKIGSREAFSGARDRIFRERKEFRDKVKAVRASRPLEEGKAVDRG